MALMIAKKENAYQKIIEEKIREKIHSFGPKTPLRDACEYSLLNGGKRLRPAIVFMIAKALGHNRDVTYPALSTEYFHTASLIADDLPCMDNDDERRNKPSLHKVYGEATALLASYTLLAAGYAALAKGAEKIPHGDSICVKALEITAFNAGIATGGQYLDIYPPDLNLETLREVIHKKTVTLFELAFAFGWLYGGGNEEKLPLVKKAASHYGIAFQIADDIGDVEQDLLNQRKINVAGTLGVEFAQKLMHTEAALFKETLQELKLDVPDLLSLLP